jgi:glycosyltransferase involved in cell wall biosynthesis
VQRRRRLWPTAEKIPLVKEAQCSTNAAGCPKAAHNVFIKNVMQMRNRLKVAQLAPYYSPAIGGAEVVCQYISEELADRGHEVHVFTANRNHRGSPRLRVTRDEIINGVNVHRFISYVNLGHYGLFPGFISLLRHGGFDIIHAHGYRQPQSEISSRIGARVNVPTILHVHGGFYTRNKLKGIFYWLYDSLARRHKVNMFDHFIVLSELDRDRLLRLNVDRASISVIRNAAENRAFDSVVSKEFRRKHDLDGKKVILYLSILHRYKRPELLVRALPKLIDKVPEVFLLFAGPDAGELEKIRELGETLGVTAYFKWIGPLKGTEKHEAFDCSEFLALPSDEDPYPLVLLEAMAHSKPVLTTSVVGQASVIRANESGIIINPGDLGGIVDGAIKLLTDSAYTKATGSNGRRLAERMFSVKSVVDEIEVLYMSMIELKNSLKLSFDRHDRSLQPDGFC